MAMVYAKNGSWVLIMPEMRLQLCGARDNYLQGILMLYADAEEKSYATNVEIDLNANAKLLTLEFRNVAGRITKPN